MPTDRIEQAIGIWDRLTWARLAMTAAAALIVVLTAYGWEHRDTVVPALIGNTVATIGAAVAMACIAVGLLGNTLLARMDRKGDVLDAYLQKQLADAHREGDELRTMVHALIKSEGDCHRRLGRAERLIMQLGGRPPLNTDYGDLT